MADSEPAVSVAFAGRDKLSPEARAALRDVWRTTRQQRGDTENHWAMYYTSLYLMAQLWPDEAGDRWAQLPSRLRGHVIDTVPSAVPPLPSEIA